ncbi:MAG: hypothetical protein ACE5NC_11645 [Anaerolineae bacterium]
MDARNRSNLAAGLVLILLGGYFLAVQLVPGLQDWIDARFGWPLIIVAAGALLLFIGLLMGVPAMSVPASVVAGVGGLLYWQNATGNWESWAYVWTLIPGFVGVGIVLSGLLRGAGGRYLRSGSSLIVTSLILFAIFGSFFGALGFIGPYWPLLLIGLGLLVLIRPAFRRRQ